MMTPDLGENTEMSVMRNDEQGQTMAEYGLIIALVAVVVIVAITLLGTNLSQLWTELADAII